MSTTYLVLTKPKTGKKLTNNDENQLVFLSNTLGYLLPSNLLSYYATNGLFESSLIEWCKQFCSPDKIMLDIGAHTGTYAISLSNSCKEVHCFEPQEMTYYALCGGVALSNAKNIHCHKVGLGAPEQRGKMQLNIISNDGGGSSVQVPANNESVLRQEYIQIETLDNYLPDLENIGFIKIDVEENEYYALLGAQESLRKSGFPKILFECNTPTNDSQLFSFLKSLGYSIVPINGYTNMFLASVE